MPLPLRWALPAALTAVLAAVAMLGRSPDAAESTATVARASLAAIDGIPQDGITLGRLDAPSTLTAYVDPWVMPPLAGSADFDRVLERYVRPGRLRVQLRTVVGEPAGDGRAMRVARALQAAGLQDRLWGLYAALEAGGPDGWVDNAELRSAAALVDGLDVARLLREQNQPRISAAIARASRMAGATSASMLPQFVLQTADGPVQRLSGPLDRALARHLDGRS